MSTADPLGFRAATQDGKKGYEVTRTNRDRVFGFVYDSPNGWCARTPGGIWVPGFKGRDYAGVFLVTWGVVLDTK